MTNDLVQQLAERNHPIIASRIKSIEELRQSIERGYLLIKFTDTEGGTELGVKLDSKDTNLESSEKKNGTVHLTGFLILNYTRVHCVADIDLATLSGSGHLEILPDNYQEPSNIPTG